MLLYIKAKIKYLEFVISFSHIIMIVKEKELIEIEIRNRINSSLMSEKSTLILSYNAVAMNFINLISL